MLSRDRLAAMLPEDVEGIYEEAAGRELRRLAARVPIDQAIVEIGVFRGRSLAFLADGADGSWVYGVDPWNLPRPSKAKYNSDSTYGYVRDLFKGFANVTLVRDFSVEAAAKYGGPKIGLLHIDADHRAAGVRADFGAWERHLAPGATVCFDDHHDDFPGVKQVVAELVRKGKLCEPRLPHGTTRLAVCEYLR